MKDQLNTVSLDTHCKIMGDIIHFVPCQQIAKYIESQLNSPKSAHTIYAIIRLLEQISSSSHGID